MVSAEAMSNFRDPVRNGLQNGLMSLANDGRILMLAAAIPGATVTIQGPHPLHWPL